MKLWAKVTTALAWLWLYASCWCGLGLDFANSNAAQGEMSDQMWARLKLKVTLRDRLRWVWISLRSDPLTAKMSNIRAKIDERSRRPMSEASKEILAQAKGAYSGALKAAAEGDYISLAEQLHQAGKHLKAYDKSHKDWLNKDRRVKFDDSGPPEWWEWGRGGPYGP